MKKSPKQPKQPKPIRSIPTFGEKTALLRYVDRDELKKGGRVPSTAFMRNPGDTYLSVNSSEIESLKVIANYYRETFQGGAGTVAIASRKVWEFNSAARAAGVLVGFNKSNKLWEFNSTLGTQTAYKHIPQTRQPKSWSHCGVMYSINFDNLAEKKFARRLQGIKPHLFKIS